MTLGGGLTARGLGCGATQMTKGVGRGERKAQTLWESFPLSIKAMTFPLNRDMR